MDGQQYPPMKHGDEQYNSAHLSGTRSPQTLGVYPSIIIAVIASEASHVDGVKQRDEKRIWVIISEGNLMSVFN